MITKGILLSRYSPSRIALRLCLLFTLVVLACTKQPTASDLIKAVSEGNLVSVKKLLEEHKLSVNTKTARGASLLMLATGAGNLELLRYLVKNKAEINYVPKASLPALHIAVINQQQSVVEYLVDAGADIELQTDGTSQSALDLARIKSRDKTLKGEQRIKAQAIFQFLSGRKTPS